MGGSCESLLGGAAGKSAHHCLTPPVVLRGNWAPTAMNIKGQWEGKEVDHCVGRGKWELSNPCLLLINIQIRSEEPISVDERLGRGQGKEDARRGKIPATSCFPPNQLQLDTIWAPSFHTREHLENPTLEVSEHLVTNVGRVGLW